MPSIFNSFQPMRKLYFQLLNPIEPIAPVDRLRMFGPKRKSTPGIGGNSDGGRANFSDLAGVDINMDDLRVGTKFGNFSCSPIVETDTYCDQQVAGIESLIG